MKLATMEEEQRVESLEVYTGAVMEMGPVEGVPTVEPVAAATVGWTVEWMVGRTAEVTALESVVATPAVTE